jgi:tRNA A37 N6-isopentenylltransferase MiaA
MTIRQRLDEVLKEMSEERLKQLLEYAEFLTERDEYEAWHEFGRRQLARLYEGEESDYTLADIKEELDT